MDIHHDDPAFGYRFITDELARRGLRAGENRVWRLCAVQGIWSVLAKRRGLVRKASPRCMTIWWGASSPQRR